MNNLKEILPYVSLLMAIVSSVLAVALSISSRNLPGRGWLVASMVITLITWPGFLIIPLIAQHTGNPPKIYPWFDVLNLFTLFGTACFALFLFSNWSSSRMKLDVKNLLFSFSGRTPRSAFWILACILFPLGTILGFAPLTTQADGFPKTIIWIVYAGWMILSIWISLAVYAKRWHDCSKSGWMSFVLLIPIIGAFWLFGYLGFVRGTSGANPYGDDPLDRQTG